MVDSGLARSEAALVRSNQRIGVVLQSFTQYACKDLICDREKAYTPIVGAYRGVSLFQDSTQSTKVPITGHVHYDWGAVSLFRPRRLVPVHWLL